VGRSSSREGRGCVVNVKRKRLKANHVGSGKRKAMFRFDDGKGIELGVSKRKLSCAQKTS